MVSYSASPRNPQRRNGVTVARIAESEGVSALAVHGRTRACGYAGEAEYDTIRAVKAEVAIPVIANGDIDSPEKAIAVQRATGADGLMIGRAAQGRPWIFREIAYYRQTGRRMPEPAASWVRDLLLEHLEALYGIYGREHGVRVARKHIAWYSRKQPGAAAFRQGINAATTPKEQGRLIRDYFDGLNDKKAPGLGPAPIEEELAA